ncbi:MAG: hypothetical protein TU36_003695 [Vulcanisaeta sp. AZ3]
MTIAFKTPITLILGRVNNKLALWNNNDNSISTLDHLLGIELIDELRADKQVSGHAAIASFGQYIIKAMDLNSRYGSYTLSDDAFIRIPSRSNIDLKKYGDWLTIRNTFILIGDPSEYISNYHPLICPYRVGDTLFINTGYVNKDNIKLILTTLGVMRNYISSGRISTTCLCRVSTMPLEIALISGDKYLLFRTYINDAQKTHANKYLILLTKGGNVISKKSTNENPLDTITEMLNEMKSL